MFKTIQIETIQKCNLKCSFCPNKDISHTGRKMTKKLYHKIIDELVKMEFAGRISPYLMNEPLLDDRLEDLISYAKKNFVMINTNGTLLTQKRLDSLKEAGLDEIRVSCYNGNTLNKISKLPVDRINDFRDGSHNFYNRAGNVDVRKNTPGGYCPKPFEQMYIRWDGSAVLCCSDYYKEAVMGDVNTESLAEIWNNEKYKEYRGHLKKGKRDLPLCDKCNF